MTKSNLWRDAYRHLVAFISDHPEIKLDECRISIPDGVRVQFYRMFDTVTEGFVKENYPVLSGEATSLMDCYNQVEGEVLGLLDLDSISITPNLDTFLHNPKQGMTKALFDPMFELLQERVDLDTFEELALTKLETMLRELSRLAYPYWVYLVLLRLLNPDAIFQVGLDREGRPLPKPSKQLALGSPPPHPMLRLPEFIIHSTSLDEYIAIKLELGREINTYTTDNRAERKRSMRDCGNTFSVLSERVMLFYILPGLDEIPIVADLNTRRVSSPDLVVGCLDGETGGWDKVKLYSAILQPSLGTWVVQAAALSGPDLPSGDENILLLHVGLDPDQLQCVIDSLRFDKCGQATKGCETTELLAQM